MQTTHLTKTLSTAFLAITFSLSTFNSFAQNVGINDSGLPPDASALLDISSSTGNKGLLIPRVALSSTASNAPIGVGIATSLLVYNTATAGVSPNNVLPGYYYWNGSKWIAFGGTGGTDWSLTGNAGTTAGTNFLGTTDAQDLTIFTNNAEKMRITSAGKVGIGTVTPQANLHVVGSVFVTQPGNLQWGKISNGGLTLYRDQTGTFTNDNGFIDFKYLAAHQNDTRIRYNHSLGTNGALEFLSNTDGISANSTSKMVILNSNGNVGIGTSTPTAKLDILHTSNLSADHILNIGRSGTGATGNGFFFTHGATATDYNAITGAGDIGMFFDIDGNPAVSSSTKGLVIAPWANGGTPGAGTGIKIQENGFVGIGTSTPGQQLTIGTNNFVFHNGGDKAIGFNCNWTPANIWTKIAGSVYQGRIHFNPTTGDLGFISSSVATGLTNLVDNKLFIEGGTGNIGIGTTTPTQKLHVVGAVRVVDGTQGANKVFTSDANGLGSWSTPTTGTLTNIATTAPITGGPITSTGTIGISKSNGTTDGYLSSTDWNTFNNKVDGSGTLNYVSKWTPDGTTLGNSQIFDNGTNVGIGTAAPSYKLHTLGDIYANGGWLRVSGNAGLFFESWGGGWNMSDATWIRTYGNKNIYQNTGIMRTDGTFQVGSGGATFQVVNGGSMTYKDGTQAANKVLTSDAIGNASWQVPAATAATGTWAGTCSSLTTGPFPVATCVGGEISTCVAGWTARIISTSSATTFRVCVKN